MLEAVKKGLEERGKRRIEKIRKLAKVELMAENLLIVGKEMDIQFQEA